MIALQISHVREFMNRLLLTDTFDAFLVSEAGVTTFASFSVDGSLRREFYADEDGMPSEDLPPEGQEKAGWNMIRPFFLQLIKGRRLPLSFRIVLELPEAQTAALLEDNGLDFRPEDIFGLFLNIQYRGGELTVTTGSSLRVFTPDRSLDQAWDRMVQEFLLVQKLE